MNNGGSLSQPQGEVGEGRGSLRIKIDDHRTRTLIIIIIIRGSGGGTVRERDWHTFTLIILYTIKIFRH